MGPLLLGIVTLTVSRAAFFDTTENVGNYLNAGSVVLTDDDALAVMFEVDDMVPGQEAIHCIAVTYEGTIADPGPVVVYSGGYADTGVLADNLNLTIEEGTGGSFADCTGFTGTAIETGGTLADFDTAHTDYATGAGTWDPAVTPETQVYQVTLELDENADNAVQGDAVTDLEFIWEVQS